MSLLSQRVNNLGESKTLAMARMTNELKSQGVDVTNLTLGEPDFAPFDFFKESAKKAIDEDYCRYSPVPGYPELKEAICEKLSRDNDLQYSPSQVVVSTGAKQSIANLMLSLINEGEEVVLPAPYWVTYFELIQFAQGTPKVIFAGVDQDFKITAEQLDEAINEKTKAFLFSNPCNPTGAVYSRKELEDLVRVFEKYPHVQIISDEIYEHIVYDGALVSLGSFDSIKDRVITVNGLSKGFAVTGWRLGYIAASDEVAKACGKIQSQFTSGTNVIAQRAAIDALKMEPSKIMPERTEIFKKRRNLICEGLSQIEGVEISIPNGAFYVFPNISAFFDKTVNGKKIENSQDVSTVLLQDFHLGSTPGHAFGAEGYIRLSYAASEQDLMQAIEKLRRFAEACV